MCTKISKFKTDHERRIWGCFSLLWLKHYWWLDTKEHALQLAKVVNLSFGLLSYVCMMQTFLFA